MPNLNQINDLLFEEQLKLEQVNLQGKIYFVSAGYAYHTPKLTSVVH